MGIVGRVVRSCYNCKIKFDAVLNSSSKGCYVFCPQCGKKIIVNSATHKVPNWTLGTVRRLK